ncbi:MAG TPA: hypothetical protein VGG72_02220 [Bryobacteraceae bacterium]|jgi:hypothetical protein
MAGLSKRLAKLEATVRTVRAKSPWSVSITEVEKVALALLSAADRGLVQQARALGGAASLCDSHPDVWNRWDAALGKAIDETGFPVRFQALDWDL